MVKEIQIEWAHKSGIILTLTVEYLVLKFGNIQITGICDQRGNVIIHKLQQTDIDYIIRQIEELRETESYDMYEDDEEEFGIYGKYDNEDEDKDEE